MSAKPVAGPMDDLSVRVQPAAGVANIFLRYQSSLYRLATIRATPWQDDSRDPFYWDYVHVPAHGYVLYLIAGPIAQVERVDALTLGLPAERIPEVRLIRVQSLDAVPTAGTPLRLGDVLRTPEVIINGLTPERLAAATDLEAFRATAGIVRDLQKVMVRTLPNGVTIQHALNHWRVDIYVPWEYPAAFAYEIVHPRNFDPFGGTSILFLGAADFHLRIVASAGVVIEGFTTSSRVREEMLATLRVETATVSIGEVPGQGAGLGDFRLSPFTKLQQKLSPRSQDANLQVELFLGMIPIVGSLVGAAEVAYEIATGESVWGETLSNEQILVHGLSTVAGAVFDASDALQILRGVLGRLHPDSKLLSEQAGQVLSDATRSQVEESTDARLLEAMRSLPDESQREVAQALEDYTVGLRSADELSSTFHVVVNAAFDEAASATLLPDRTLTEALGYLHPTQLDGFDAMPSTLQHQVLDTYRSVVVGGKPPRLVIDTLSPELNAGFESFLDQWRMLGAFNVFNDGFRSPVLAEGFARYVSTGKAKNAVQWAVAQRSGRYVEELVRVIGGDFRTVIKNAAPKLYLEVSAVARAHFENLANVPLIYSELRQANSGFGNLFEVDHILEQRFFHKPEFEDYFNRHVDQFWSLLVPKNPTVGRQLAPHFYYVHSVKTQYLRRLIPNGREAAFTLQEIYDAYVFVMIWQLDVPVHMFSASVTDTFTELSQLSGEAFNPSILDVGGLYARHPTW